MTVPTSNTAFFDALLDTSLTEIGGAHGAAIKVAKQGYNDLVKHQNLRTYSTTEVLHSCPRKYAIKKMQANAGTTDRINSPTFAFGHAVGAGVAVYDDKQDLRQAIWAAFLSWDVDLLVEETNKAGKKTGKSFYQAVWALYQYEQFFQEETDLRDYEMVKIEGTVAIDFEDGHFYSGHIDEVLRHKVSGRYRVKENKTTGFKNVDPALYSNSDQALSYSVVIDQLGGNEYEVMYTVYSAGDEKWLQFGFVKQTFKKAEWLQDQLLVNQQVDNYKELKFFPKRGGSCFQFMRRCEFYETCDTSFDYAFQMHFKDLPVISGIHDIAAIEHVDFSTTMTEIVKRQKEKLHDPR